MMRPLKSMSVLKEIALEIFICHWSLINIEIFRFIYQFIRPDDEFIFKKRKRLTLANLQIINKIII